jgi:outer membrane protein assembly factor BamB
VFGASGYGDGGSCLVKLVKSGSGVTAEEVWYKRANELQNHHGGVILLGDHLYMGHGNNQGFPVCVNFMTGKDAWRPGRGPGEGSAAIVCADGHLYFRYEGGDMALIEATPSEYHLKGKFRIKTKHSASWPHPVVLDGKLYLRDQQDLHCYNVKKS